MVKKSKFKSTPTANLEFYFLTSEEDRQKIYDEAQVLIQALIDSGKTTDEAKSAVQSLYEKAYQEGHRTGLYENTDDGSGDSWAI